MLKVVRRAREWLGWVGTPWRILSPAGRSVAALGTLAIVAGEWAGLAELRLLGLLFWVLLGCCVPWMLVPAKVRSAITLYPRAAVVGEGVTATLRVTSQGRWPVFQPLVRLPAGTHDGWLRFPTVGRGKSLTQSRTVSTQRRGVLLVGPAVYHRADPLGMLVRQTVWVDPVELYVRPRMVPVDSLTGAEVRDLEGVPSDQMSMSDLAFHALREYVPGDDLRHVHWRSSARAGELLVRQYHDSRRTEAALILDRSADSYTDEASFELAVEIAASLAAATSRTGHELAFFGGDERVVRLPVHSVLDALCRVEWGGEGAGSLPEDVTAMQVVAPSTSLVLVVTGGYATAEQFARLGALPADVGVLIIRAVHGAPSALTRQPSWTIRTLGALGDLPGLMAVR